jgi:hypothetical protein
MSGPRRLYHELHGALKQLRSKGRPELMRTLALLMVGMFESRDVRLSRMAERVPLASQEDSIVQRFRRWLKNPQVDERAIYDPVAVNLLGGLAHIRLRIQIDRTLVKDRFNTLIVSVYYHKRAIPLVWLVLSHKGYSTFREQQAILAHLAALLPGGAKVLLLGDREFGVPDFMRTVRGYDWDFCLRVKGSHQLCLPHGQWIALYALAPLAHSAYFLTDVFFTATNTFGPLHFALAADATADDPWFIATNCIPSQRTLRDYARRFGCEELFSDLKARGFHLDLSQLRHADRFSRLLLVIALLYVWVLLLARRVCLAGLAHTLTYRPLCRRYSLFQLGRRWLARQLTLDKPLLPACHATAWCLP